jgi:hypothetical protein
VINLAQRRLFISAFNAAQCRYYTKHLDNSTIFGIPGSIWTYRRERAITPNNKTGFPVKTLGNFQISVPEPENLGRNWQLSRLLEGDSARKRQRHSPKRKCAASIGGK